MKSLLICLFFVFGIFSNLSAQHAVLNHPDTSVKILDLDNVIIKGHKPAAYGNRVKTLNISLVFNGPTDSLHHGWDSTYFLTRFPALDNVPVKLCKITCRLKPFDTALFIPQFALFQIANGDTLLRTVDIRNADNIVKNILVVNLSNENLVIAPGEFYLGYSFVTKNHEREFHYRLYATDRGEGAMLTFVNKKMQIISDAALPYAFPFKITYLRL